MARAALRDVFGWFFKLGWLAFGGPVAQVGIMHLECVERRRWLTEDEFVRALNFCHVLPGPEATQLAIYIGYRHAGLAGGILAGVLFILPGYLTLTALAWVYVHHGNEPAVLGVLWGFRPVGLALLLAALVRISRAALEGPFAVLLAVAAFGAFHFLRVPFPVVLVVCGLLFVLRTRLAAGAAAVVALLASAPAIAAEALAKRTLDISWFSLKVGLFSFGGAYAVLPYLREGSVITHRWITDAQMIDALALGETTPGPLISIGAFIGYLAGHPAGSGVLGATAATFWMFLPSFFFILVAAPHMDAITGLRGVSAFLRGVTSGVVGVMFSVSIPLAQVAFVRGGKVDWWTLGLGLAAFLAVTFWKHRLNVVAVVLGGGALGILRAFAPGLFGGAPG